MTAQLDFDSLDSGDRSSVPPSLIADTEDWAYDGVLSVTHEFLRQIPSDRLTW